MSKRQYLKRSGNLRVQHIFDISRISEGKVTEFLESLRENDSIEKKEINIANMIDILTAKGKINNYEELIKT